MDFAGFLFGNVNEQGELVDEEVLDKVFREGCVVSLLIKLVFLLKDCVAGLSRLGVGLESVINEELSGRVEEEEEEDSDEGGEGVAALAAEDFMDIAEVSIAELGR